MRLFQSRISCVARATPPEFIKALARVPAAPARRSTTIRWLFLLPVRPLLIDPPLSCHSAAERDRSGSSLARLIKIHVLGQSAVVTWTPTLPVRLYIFRELHSNFEISTFILALHLIEMKMDCFAAKPQ